MGYQRIAFFGVVYLKEWLQYRDGRAYKSVAGVVSVLSDEEVLGFRTRGTESNWTARVENATRDGSVSILGCQIRAIEAISREVYERHADTLYLD